MVRIGLVGIGFMGWIHYLATKRLRGANLAAVCSRDAKKLTGDWRGIRGNFGPPGEQVDLTGVKTYDRLEALLADPEIDVVDICNPTDQHPATAIAALRAGKHVLVEKAIALKPEDADQMVAEARKAGKMLMVAHVLPFFPEFAYAAEAIRSGRHGKLLAAHFVRVISQPDWSAAIGDAARTGGPAVDLHIHDTHFIGLVCGVPERVSSVGVCDGDAVTHLTTLYHYGKGGPAVSCTSGAIARQGRPFVHGFEIYLEKATLVYSSDGKPLTLLNATGGTEVVALEGGGDPITAFANELQAAVDGVSTGSEPDLLRGQLARDALVLCHRECDSVRQGIPISVK